MRDEATEETGKTGPGATVSHVLGEITWLLSQSPLHRALPIEALEWLVMPALIVRQFYIFRDGDRPVGVALWAQCGPAAERKLQGGMIEPENRLALEEWTSGEALWLVDLVAPFATDANRQREIMMADLICGPMLGKAFKFHQLDPESGRRVVRSIEADAAERLREAIAAAAD
jgi:cytolysin-activating lysine-acyltransferase